MEKNRITLSVAMATYNEEENLPHCLSSVQGLAEEIIIVDGGSTDKTREIAKHFSARVISTDNPPIFHINKQKALEACRGDWVLQLDADEVLTDALKAEIVSLLSSSPKENGFYIPRKNFFLGRWMRKGGQYPDYLIRLIRSRKAHFPCQSVHEQIAVEGKKGYMNEPLLHYSFRSVSEYWRKADSYIALEVSEMKNQHIQRNMSTYLKYNFFKPLSVFLLLFVRHKGFVDGYVGFLFALFSALHYPIAYRKYLRS